jgi:hypothetical protein
MFFTANWECWNNLLRKSHLIMQLTMFYIHEIVGKGLKSSNFSDNIWQHGKNVTALYFDGTSQFKGKRKFYLIFIISRLFCCCSSCIIFLKRSFIGSLNQLSIEATLKLPLSLQRLTEIQIPSKFDSLPIRHLENRTITHQSRFRRSIETIVEE